MQIWEIEHAHRIIEAMQNEHRIVVQRKVDNLNLPMDIVGTIRHWQWTENGEVAHCLSDHTEWYVRITWSTGWDQFIKFTDLMSMLFFDECVITSRP